MLSYHKEFLEKVAQIPKPFVIAKQRMKKAGGEMQAIICDIDGCLFDTGWIFEETEKLGLTGEEKWDFFHKHINDEKSRTCEQMKNFLTNVISKDIGIIFMTARSEIIRAETERRIYKELGKREYFYPVFMRQLTSYESSEVVKEEMLKKVLYTYGIDVVLAIDDDPKNCAMFESYGIPSLQWKILNNRTLEKKEEEIPA